MVQLHKVYTNEIADGLGRRMKKGINQSRNGQVRPRQKAKTIIDSIYLFHSRPDAQGHFVYFKYPHHSIVFLACVSMICDYSNELCVAVQ